MATCQIPWARIVAKGVAIAGSLLTIGCNFNRFGYRRVNRIPAAVSAEMTTQMQAEVLGQILALENLIEPGDGITAVCLRLAQATQVPSEITEQDSQVSLAVRPFVDCAPSRRPDGRTVLQTSEGETAFGVSISAPEAFNLEEDVFAYVSIEVGIGGRGPGRPSARIVCSARNYPQQSFYCPSTWRR